jgi:ATP-dependent DNA ligase
MPMCPMMHPFTMPAPKAFSLEPMFCESAERPPASREWRYELELDGFRANWSQIRAQRAALIAQSEGFHT